MMRSKQKVRDTNSQRKLNRLASELNDESTLESLTFSTDFSIDAPIYQPGKVYHPLKTDEISSKSKMKTDSSKYLLYSCGNNIHSQGDRGASQGYLRTQFSLCSSQYKFVDKIFASSNLSSAVMDDGSAHVWGHGIPSMQSKLYSSLISLPQVRFISCGRSHIALINSQCEVFTWGVDEFGCLGHNNTKNDGRKNDTIATPKQVEFFRGISVINVSCGGYHTAFIALGLNDRLYGDVYTCGQGKGGQLGLGESILATSIPTRLLSLHVMGFKVSRASCGLHHTLLLGIHSEAVSSTASNKLRLHTVFSFGFGESGRLGLNNSEVSVFLPTPVQFDSVHFNPIYIGAGESHSIAASSSVCYSWGNNDLCQLGIGMSPELLQYSASPLQVALPAHLGIAKLSVGSRHSGVITTCGNVYTWGWNEEGQCGQRCERNAAYPRPCRIEGVSSSSMVAADIVCGLTHSLLLMKNSRYVERRKAAIVHEPFFAVLESSRESLEINKEGGITIDGVFLEEVYLRLVDQLVRDVGVEEFQDASVIVEKKDAVVETIRGDEIEEPIGQVVELPQEVSLLARVRTLDLRDILAQREERYNSVLPFFVVIYLL